MAKSSEVIGGLVPLDGVRKALVRHKDAINVPKTGMHKYLGRGGQLLQPGIRPYQAYADGNEHGLRIAFLGEHPHASELHVQLGSVDISLHANEVAINALAAGNWSQEQGDYPELSRLAQPFGSWIVNGVAESIKRRNDPYAAAAAENVTAKPSLEDSRNLIDFVYQSTQTAVSHYEMPIPGVSGQVIVPTQGQMRIKR